MPTSSVPAPGVFAIQLSRALPALLLIVAAALAVYLPTPGNYWIRYDNEALIRNSPQVNALAGDDKLAALVTMFTSTHYSLYQPLFTLSVALDHALFGWDLAGFHAHSVLLHVVVVVLLLFLLFRLTGSWLAASAASLLVAVHPALVETVRWAICRNSQVAAVWLLTGALLDLAHLDRPGRMTLWTSQIAFGLSLLGKVSPAIVAIPFVLDLWRHRRIDRRALLEKVPLLAITVLLTWVNYRATLAHVAESPLQRPWSEVLGYLPTATALMTANALAPSHLAILYPPAAMASLLGWRGALVLAVLFSALVAGLRAWRRGERGLLLGLFAWFALLLPNVAAGRFRTTIASDRYLYLPILFLAATLAALIVALLRKPAAPANPEPGWRAGARWGVAAAVLAAGAYLGFAAGNETRRWEDEHRIWQRVNELAPHYMAYYMLGNLASRDEQWTAASDLYAKALELAQLDRYAKHDPIYSKAVLQSSRKAATELAKQPEAETQQSRETLLERVQEVAAEAAASLPGNPEVQFELGKTQYKQKNYREAIAALDAALALDPRHYQALTYKAMSQYFLGQKEQAILSFRNSLAIQPYWVTYSNLGKVYLAEGKPAEAVAVALNWLELDAKSEEAHKRFFQAVGEMIRQGSGKAAIVQIDLYLTRFPDSAPAKSLLQQTKEYLAGR
ncbi:MAG: tetratricopeptide repeat protein [Thermoanaerobaculia bacterium]